MGEHNREPHTFPQHAWEKLSEAVDAAWEEIKEDSEPTHDNNYSPEEEPHPDTVAEMLEHMAWCFRNDCDFNRMPNKPSERI